MAVAGPPDAVRQHIRYAAAMEADSAETLMLRFGAGDADAFAALYAQYKGPLYRYLRRRLDPSAGRTDDLFQECWARVINARRHYRPSAKFDAWLFRIAHNLILDEYRRQARDRHYLASAESAMPEAALDASQEPENRLAQQQRAADILAGIAALPAEQRDAFLLREEGGFTIEQIAHITGVAPETAKSRLRYAVRKLHRMLAAGMESA